MQKVDVYLLNGFDHIPLEFDLFPEARRKMTSLNDLHVQIADT
jgi:hypothetical protein